MHWRLARENQGADVVPLADAPEPRAAVVPEVLREPVGASLGQPSNQEGVTSGSLLPKVMRTSSGPCGELFCREEDGDGRVPDCVR